MGLVIAVAILAVLTAAGVTVYIKVRRLSESLLGTPDVTEGINRIRENVSTTPKSVSGMTRLMEPQIKRDFPEFGNSLRECQKECLCQHFVQSRLRIFTSWTVRLLMR